MHRHPGGHLPHCGQISAVVLRQIRLGQHDHRRGPGLPGQGEVALQPPEIEVLVQGLEKKNIVKICRHRLLSPAPVRVPAGEEGSAGQGGENQTVAVGNIPEHHEIPHRREVRGAAVVGSGLQPGTGFAVFADNLIALLMNRRHSPGDARAAFGAGYKTIICYIQVFYPPIVVYFP